MDKANHSRGLTIATGEAPSDIPAINALAEAVRVAFALPAGRPDAWPDALAEAIGAVHRTAGDTLDSLAREKVAHEGTKAGMDLAQTANSALRRECEELRRAKVTAERERDAIKGTATRIELQRDEARSARDSYALARDNAMAESLRYKEQAGKLARQLEAIMRELGGWTLSMLPPNAYGGALASVYSDIRAGREP